MRHALVTCCTGLLIAASSAVGEAAPSGVTVAKTNAATVGGKTVYSSTRLLVSWTPTPSDQTHHFEIVGRETAQGTEVRALAASTATSLTLTDLKALTTYAVVVTACRNEACTQSSAASSVSAETDTEYWQFRGAGNTVDKLTQVVSDGNARLSATRFGPDAGDMANRVQLYYGPMGTSGTSTLAVAVASGAADAANPDSFLSFTSRSGSSGLTSVASGATLVKTVSTGQGVPLARGTSGGKVRLFFEATGADSKTRIMSIDSKDGYFGLDFNSGSASTCSTAADYATGGGCVPTVAIAVDGDTGGNVGITNARQFKVAWPTLESPHWDMAVGTFMVFTTDRVTGCSAGLGGGDPAESVTTATSRA